MDLFLGQVFGKEVSYVIERGYVLEGNVSSLHLIFNEVVLYINMLCSPMVLVI